VSAWGASWATSWGVAWGLDVVFVPSFLFVDQEQELGTWYLAKRINTGAEFDFSATVLEQVRGEAKPSQEPYFSKACCLREPYLYARELLVTWDDSRAVVLRSQVSSFEGTREVKTASAPACRIAKDSSRRYSVSVRKGYEVLK
jgi:hypothetical protein